MKIAIGNDHGALVLKQQVIEYLISNKISFVDCGCQEKGDYPDFAKEVVNKILSKECDYGVLLCGTGIGMSMTANRFSGIRAAVCTDSYQAISTRAHNDANILCMGERVVGSGVALSILKEFLSTNFEGGRHVQRLVKMDDTYEKKI